MNQPSQARGKFNLQLAALTVIPVLLFCLSMVLKTQYGPYFLGYHSDPEYAYLLNSLNIIHFIVPGHTDHPGTTLQLLGAVGLLLKWFAHLAAGGQLGLDQFVLGHPEESLAGINLLLNAVVLVAFIFASYSIYRSMHGMLPVLVFQLSLLVPLQVKFSMVRVTPEPLLVFLLMLLTGLAVRYRHPYPGMAGASGLPLLVGMVMGFALATKVTFLPLLLLILLFSAGRERVTALAGCAMSFLLATLPITTKFPQMLIWFGSIAAHEGRYGNGEIGIQPVAVLVENLITLGKQEPSLFVFLACYLTYLLMRKLRAGESMTDGGNKLLFLGSSAIVVQILITVKHPAAHYLLPAIALTALLNAELFVLVKRKLIFPRAGFESVLLLIAAIAGTAYSLYSINTWVAESERYRRSEANLALTLGALDGCTTVSYFRASTVQYALSFGNDFAGSRYATELSEIYPGMIFYNVWSRQFRNYREVLHPAAVTALLKQRRVLLVGMPLGPEIKDYLTLALLIETPHANVYELEGCTPHLQARP